MYINYSGYHSDIPYYKDIVMYYNSGHLNMYGRDFFKKKVRIL